MIDLFELDVYKLSELLPDLVWNEYDERPDIAKKTIGYKIIRSADSIVANIAEGYGRYTPGERKLFYRYARGSFGETKCWLRKAIRRKIIVESNVRKFTEMINELGPKLNAFIKSTK